MNQEGYRSASLSKAFFAAGLAFFYAALVLEKASIPQKILYSLAKFALSADSITRVVTRGGYLDFRQIQLEREQEHS